jgi:hypothetical protein
MFAVSASIRLLSISCLKTMREVLGLGRRDYKEVTLGLQSQSMLINKIYALEASSGKPTRSEYLTRQALERALEH